MMPTGSLGIFSDENRAPRMIQHNGFAMNTESIHQATESAGKDRPPERHAPDPPAKGDRTVESQRKHAVLIVDDEKGVLRAIKRALIDEPYEVLAAENGNDALDVIKRRPVTVIISDYRMPGLSGTDLLKAVREQSPRTVRILLTGAADTKVVGKAIDDGIIYKFLTKPWDDADLAVTVRLAISQHELLEENARLKKLSATQQKELKKLSRFAGTEKSSLGSLLVKEGVLLPAQMEMIEEYCSANNVATVRALTDMGMVDENTLLRVIQNATSTDVTVLGEQNLDRELMPLVSREVCEASCIVPVRSDAGSVLLAVANPLDLPAVDYVRFQSGSEFSLRLASVREIDQAIRYLFAGQDDASEEEALLFYEDADEVDLHFTDDDFQSPEELLAQSSAPTAVQMVNAIIAEAISAAASDLHIEPHSDATSVRYRIDGLLQERMRIPANQHLTTVSRLKILAKIDISIRRLPQDGRISIKHRDRLIDLRVSTMPTIYGEKVVCRLLDKSVSVRSVDELGVRHDSLLRLRKIIQVPEGIIIATGPTGSGKTTTLYSLLQERIADSQNFVTIEDPVEYFVDQASQVHIHHKAGLTFASTLRATLRQDPDVILVGEVRDYETAQAAFQAAMTGH